MAHCGSIGMYDGSFKRLVDMDANAEIDKLYNEFRERYGFISITREVVADYYYNMYGKSIRIDMLLDYILANGLEEDIEL